ncbi:hypothetical protein FQZ79_21395, partial [Salmonella enterica]|nr:hypothetical protein [Salmonella enterica]
RSLKEFAAIFYLAKCLIYYCDEVSYSQKLIIASDTLGINRKVIALRYLSLQDEEIIFLTFYVDNNSNGADRMPEPGVRNSREIHET